MRVYLFLVQVFLVFRVKLIFLVRKQHRSTPYRNTEPKYQLRHIVKLLQLTPIATRLPALLQLTPFNLLQLTPIATRLGTSTVTIDPFKIVTIVPIVPLHL